jgi:hypothetical protein
MKRKQPYRHPMQQRSAVPASATAGSAPRFTSFAIKKKEPAADCFPFSNPPGIV